VIRAKKVNFPSHIWQVSGNLFWHPAKPKLNAVLSAPSKRFEIGFISAFEGILLPEARPFLGHAVKTVSPHLGLADDQPKQVRDEALEVDAQLFFASHVDFVAFGSEEVDLHDPPVDLEARVNNQATLADPAVVDQDVD